MSHINGIGFGSSHDWERFRQPQAKYTVYKCKNCGVVFSHPYDEIPDIFEAIKRSGVSDVCPVAIQDIAESED